jgi:hypothetical protein
MTETEWLACADPQKMLKFFRGRLSDRKLRLFAVACCRRAWHLFPNERSRQAVAVAERQADGRASVEECKQAEAEADDVWMGPPEDFSDAQCEAAFLAYAALNPKASEAARLVSSVAVTCREYSGEDEAEQAAQCLLLLDMVGPPSRSISVKPEWLTPDAVALAQAIYDEQAFDRLPTLASALEEAGCGTPEVLEHCRQPGEHVRGCWVVDLILGKE